MSNISCKEQKLDEWQFPLQSYSQPVYLHTKWVGNKVGDYSDVVEVLPVGATPTTYQISN